MAHELSIRENGFVEHAYVGEVGWHGLGNQLPVNAPISKWMEVAGMDWRILRSMIRYATSRDQEEDLRIMENRHVLFRSDSKAPLSVVSNEYKIVQPQEILEFFRDLVAGAGFTLDTAGVIFGGKRFFASAKINAEGSIGAGDTFKGYLLLTTSCDGSTPTQAHNTLIRAVCKNTIEAGIRTGKLGARVSHRTVFDPDAMKRQMDIAPKQFAETMEQFRRLADTRITSQEALEMTVELFRPGAAKMAREEFEKVLDSRPAKKVVELVLDGTALGSNLPGVRGTAYGWLNGVTEYVDHHARSHSDDGRLANALFGRGNALKSRALMLASAA